MIKSKIKDLNPKVFKVILVWALVTYIIQIIATITGQMFKGGISLQYQVTSWLISLSVPVVALFIGLLASKLRHQQNKLQFAVIFAISAFLLYLICQVLLPYGNGIFWQINGTGYYVAPMIVAVIIQTLISVLLTKSHNSIQASSTHWYIVVLSLLVVVTQAFQSIQMIPSLMNFANVANTTHTIVLPVALWLMLVAPVVLLALLITLNNIGLRTIKNIAQRLFLACIVAIYAFVIVISLLNFSGIEPLHNVSNLWICIFSYLAAFVINGIIACHLRKLIN